MFRPVVAIVRFLQRLRRVYVFVCIRIQHLSKHLVLFDYTLLPIICYTHNGDDTP